MRKLYKLVTLVILVLVISCEEENPITPERASFELQTDVSIMISNKLVHEFDQAQHQIIYTVDKKKYMITNLNQTEYYSLEITPSPELNLGVGVTFKSSGIEAVNLSESSYNMTVVKEEEGKLWLWSEEDLVGFVLKY